MLQTTKIQNSFLALLSNSLVLFIAGLTLVFTQTTYAKGTPHQKGMAMGMNHKVSIKDKKASAARGAKIYNKACFSCHAKDGGGLVGPNLTDKYWIESDGSFHGIMHSIMHGNPAKGMMPKGGFPLTSQEIVDLTYYVQSLQGTTPAKPKKAEGKKVK